MNKYPFPTSSQYNIIIEAEIEEKAQEIYNEIFKE